MKKHIIPYLFGLSLDVAVLVLVNHWPVTNERRSDSLPTGNSDIAQEVQVVQTAGDSRLNQPVSLKSPTTVDSTVAKTLEMLRLISKIRLLAFPAELNMRRSSVLYPTKVTLAEQDY